MLSPSLYNAPVCYPGDPGAPIDFECTSEVITPQPISPTFGYYTKEKPPHKVGSWLHDVRRDVSW